MMPHGAWEVSTVAEDEIVAHQVVGGGPGAAQGGPEPTGSRPGAAQGVPQPAQGDPEPAQGGPASTRYRPAVERLTGLSPDTEYRLLGGVMAARTLPRPPGRRLATVATVNDLHFGETEAGFLDGPAPVRGIRVAPGEPPHPETMNQAAAAEVAALAPDAVVVKGDMTDAGRPEEMAAFLSCWEPAAPGRLYWVPGNHDVIGGTAVGPPTTEIAVPGLRLALLDTTIPGQETGRVSPDQVAWLDELGSRADRPVLVLGHHHPWDPASRHRPDHYFGINPDDSERLVAAVARRPAIVGYAAGHTHRNRVRRFAATGSMPWVEVACVKDFPGSWVEYRVFEGGVLQIHRRISAPAALDWSERCRAILDGWYPTYALGSLADRCLALWPRRETGPANAVAAGSAR